jgi:hypothetical protein
VTAQNIANCLISDMISKIGERPDNPVIAPGPIFLGHPNNQFLDFFVNWREFACDHSPAVLAAVDAADRNMRAKGRIEWWDEDREIVLETCAPLIEAESR